MGLSSRILDVSDDPSASLLKEAAHQGLKPPDYVLSHRLPTDTQALPDELFAYVDRSHSGGVRKYACDSKATTWINTLYFLKKGGVLPQQTQQKVAERLQHFHSLYGSTPPDLLLKVAAAQAVIPEDYQLPPEPVTENLFALVKTSKAPMYPIPDWAYVKRACDYFEQNWRVMPVLQRREFCTKVAQRVRDLAKETVQGRHEIATSLAKVASLDHKNGQDPAHRLPELMEIYASQIPCDARITAAIGERVRTLEKRNQKELANTFRTLYDNRGSFTVDKFAEALVRMDEASGLDDLYGRRLMDPYLSILKLADDPLHDVVYDEDGIRLTRGDMQRFSKISAELYRRFEPNLVKELVADPEAVFPSLPRPEKQALAALLK